MGFEWDCDCGWELDFEPGMPPPPLFDLPPPPVPPSLQPPAELCSAAAAHPLGLETCQAFLISDAEYREPANKVADWMPFVFASAVTLTIIFIAVLVWRYKRQREQQQAKSLLRCQQKTLSGAGVMDVPALLQGLADHQVTRVDDCDEDDEDGVFYDELISYPTHFRTATRPPAYEMKDVLFKSPNSSPCHCTTHPLLGNGGQPRVQHYVSSPYEASGSGGSHSPPTSSTPTAEADCSWTAEPVYEELPSGPDDDVRFTRDPRTRNGSASVHRGGSVTRKASKASTNSSGQWSDEPCETDFFLPPSTWYRQPHANMSLIRGQLTAHGPVRQGRGGIRAAWRELEQPVPQPQQPQQHPTATNGADQSLQPASNHAGRNKRKVKSSPRADSAHDEQPLHYHSTGLYRGKCPPEEPPFTADTEEPLHREESTHSQEQNSTPSKTLPRYYYYSESDDYGVGNPKRTLSSIRRSNNQRHLTRHQRTQQQQAPTLDSLA